MPRELKPRKWQALHNRGSITVC